jgi:Flp pilus assembly protein TadD
LVKQGKLNEGVAALKKTTEIAPKAAPAYFGLGVALNQQGKKSESIEAMKKARDLFKEQGQTQQADQIDQGLKALEKQ